MILELKDQTKYNITISLYRITSLDGEIDIIDDKAVFIDEDDLIKADVSIQNNEIIIKIIESNFEYIDTGSIYIFEKQDI